MSLFLLLNLLLLIQQSFQISEGDTFLINYEKLNLCMQRGETSVISLSKCNQDNEFQKFKWTASQQILNMGLKLCLGASANFDQLEFSSCNQTNELQKWACLNDTFPAIKGKNWFLSYGAGRVQLNNVPDVKATWKIDGTQDRLCTKGFEAQFTIDGNSFGDPCVFPFKYKENWYAECITIDSENQQPWCGTTADVDKDSLTGYCPVKDDNEHFWTRNHETGNQYQINFGSALTWLQARKSCQQQNAELLSITERHEQAYLAGLTSGMNADYWIGLNSLDMDSGWQWAGNHPFRYLSWAPGSPSPESEKMCATMQSQSGKWENKDCNLKLGYICKKENSSLNVPVISSDDLKPVKCPDGWVPYLGHCYRLSRDLRSWKGAQSSCRKEGGDLASIHNIEEYSFVISQLGYHPTDTLWIGLNAQKTDRYFEWSDGSYVTYTKWQTGEPAYRQDSLENCVIMTGENGYWMDIFCQEEYGYICKRKPLETLSESVADPGCQNGWKRHGFYCYLSGQTLGTFSEAKKFCERNKGSLVFIEDRYEQAYLTSLVGLRPEKYFWIGISEIQEGWIFNWTNGHVVTFSHWNSGMPGQNHGCVAMRTGTAAGLWDVVSCEETAAFICKQWAEGVTTTLAPTTPRPPPCLEGWSGTETSSSCFKMFKEEKYMKRTWFEARDFCKEIGGDLASIHSHEEQSKIQELNADETWIGMSLLDSDIGSTWSDGSPVDFENWYPWFSPDLDAEQQCIRVGSYFSYWIISSCSYLFHWTCQLKRGAVLKPEPNDTFVGSFKIIEDGWVKFEDNEYYFHNSTLSMGEARQFCRQQSGDLAVITSEKERTFLWKYNVFRAFNDDVYIGLTVGVDGKFRWLDGTLVTYEAWSPNEPNNANEEEDCVIMYKRTGLWNDISCSVEKRFICERHNSSVRSTIAPTSPAPQGVCNDGWLLFNNKCFQIFGIMEEERKNWSAARTACKSLDGNLATIPNKEVQAFLTMHLKNVPVDSWIGLHDIIEEGEFLWTDGSPVRYTNWAGSGPSSTHRWFSYREDCVAMIKEPEKWAGNWKVIRCSIKYGYFCQKNTDPVSFHPETTIPASNYMPYGNRNYSFSVHATWEEARKDCHSKHSELSSIPNPYIQSFLWLLVLKYREPVWIGLNSNVTNGNYRWVSNWKMEYTNWAPEEPKEKLACVYLDLDGQWKTETCKKEYLGVCEQHNDTTPTDYPEVHGRCPEYQAYQSWIPFRANCYLIMLGWESWPSASLKCSQLGGSLTSIEDSAEMMFLKEQMQHFGGERFWIGLLQNVDGKWIWLDGTAVDFVNWNTEEAQREIEIGHFDSDDPELNRGCAAVETEHGKWFITHCHFHLAGYICKTPKIIEAIPTKESSNSGGVKKEESSSSAHGTVAMVVILVLLILTVAGIAGYIFYKKRFRQQVTIAGFNNSMYRDNVVMLQNNDPEYLVENSDSKHGQ